MKPHFPTRLLSCLMVAVMLFTTLAASVFAAEGDGKDRYVKDVYIAYGDTKEKAENWLRDNGWEPLFGTERTVEALNSIPAGAAQKDVLSGVRATVDAFVKDAPQFDDLTMLGLRYNGPKEIDAAEDTQ